MNSNFTIEEADTFLKLHIREDRKKIHPNLIHPNNFYKHSKSVSNISFTINYKLHLENPELIGIAGLLHDIGKLIINRDEREKDPELIVDAIYGSKYLERLGYNKIAKIIKTSFTTKELVEFKFTEIDSDDFIPKTIEQKIVVYADCHVSGGGKYVSFDERINDIRKSYNKNSLKIKSLDMGGEKRLRNLNEEIDNMLK